jgi:hypothetical protein
MNEPMTLQAAREQAIDALCRRFADDTLSMAELERRLERARAARTREELRTLLSDLPARQNVPARGDAAAGSPARSRGSARPTAQYPAGRSPQRARQNEARRPTRRPAGSDGEVRTSSSVALAVLGGTRRAGKWSPPESMLALAAMGGVELDFRDAVLEPGSVTTITCFAFWGGIDITVPPDVRLDTDGFALLGGFDQSGDAWADPEQGAPTIRVNGFALMGGVDVKVREREEGASKRRQLPRKRDEGHR